MWWITSLFVDSEHRRRGCFKLLYEHARSQAIREGVAGIRVYTVNDNLAAQETVSEVLFGLLPSSLRALSVIDLTLYYMLCSMKLWA